MVMHKSVIRGIISYIIYWALNLLVHRIKKDMKQEQYLGMITPNISGFISSCIRKEDDER